MKLYAAIDLHSTNYVTMVIDEQDQVVYQKRLPNDLGPRIIREMLGTLQSFPQGARGVIITSTDLTPGAKRLAIEKGISS